METQFREREDELVLMAHLLLMVFPATPAGPVRLVTLVCRV